MNANQEPLLPSRTSPDLVRAAARAFGSAPAIVTESETLSFAELAERAARTAAAFVAAGIERGDRVAIWAPNSARWIVSCLGLQCAGAVLVPINTRFRGDE